MEDATDRLLQLQQDQIIRAKWAIELEEKYGVRRQQEQAPKSRLRWLRYGASIAASLLLACLAWQWWPASATNYQQMADTYLSQPFEIKQTRKGAQEIERLRGQAMEAYNNKAYDRAVVFRNAIVSSGQATKEDHFYLGLSYLYQQPSLANDAAEQMEIALTFPERRYREEIHWFLALAYVKAERLEEARSSLQNIIDRKYWNADKAVELIENIPEK